MGTGICMAKEFGLGLVESGKGLYSVDYKRITGWYTSKSSCRMIKLLASWH